jgi:hypothetical protein
MESDPNMINVNDLRYYGLSYDPNAKMVGSYSGTYDEILKINNCTYKYAYVGTTTRSHLTVGSADLNLIDVNLTNILILSNALPSNSILIPSVNNIPAPPTGYNSTITGSFIDNPSYITLVLQMNTGTKKNILYISIYQLY